MISTDSKILITGANGLVGSALIGELKKKGYTNLVPLTRVDCDLTNFADVKAFFTNIEPEVVFHLAASVYGIQGNKKKRGGLFLENILMNTHVVETCRLVKVKKIVAMGTIATYPDAKKIPTPVKENSIWDGPPHDQHESCS